MRFLLISFLIGFLFTDSQAQVYTFQTSYDILSATAYTARTNIICTSDGSFVTPVVSIDPSGITRQLVLVKTDGNGNLLWANRLEAELFSMYGYSNAFVAETSDGGFVVEVLIASLTTNPAVVLFRTDLSGTVLWERSFEAPFRSSSNVLVATDGSIVLTGTMRVTPTDDDFWIARVDATGNFLWAKQYSLSLSEEVFTACTAANGDIVVGGTVYDTGGDLGIIRIDLAGNLIWGNMYRGPGDDWAFDLKPMSNGDFVCVGRAANPDPTTGCWDISVIRCASNGSLIWSWYYGGNQCDEGYGVVEDDDGSLVFACEPESFIGTSQSALMKTRANGDFVWMKTYNDANGTFPNSIARTPDGGYVLLGTYGTFSSFVCPVFLNKANAEGDVNCGTRSVIPHKMPYPILVTSGANVANSVPMITENHIWQTESGSVTVICERAPVSEHADVPNVFTPNDDGINELFVVSYTGGTNFHLWIYDRWGVLMFETTDRFEHWDGTSKSGNLATAGTYYYLIETDMNAYTGFFTLLR